MRTSFVYTEEVLIYPNTFTAVPYANQCNVMVVKVRRSQHDTQCQPQNRHPKLLFGLVY